MARLKTPEPRDIIKRDGKFYRIVEIFDPYERPDGQPSIFGGKSYFLRVTRLTGTNYGPHLYTTGRDFVYTFNQGRGKKVLAYTEADLTLFKLAE